MKKILTLLLAFLSFQVTLLAQTRTISGRVTDEAGAPVAGASVLVKGTTIGTSTGDNGSYTLQRVPSNATTLVISSLGRPNREVSITGNTVNITLGASAATEMETVVVTVPYGTVKKKAFTGAENTLSGQQLAKQQNTSITKSLEGQVAGIQTINGGGAPGTGTDIRIRGIGSINASSSPLYVLNGVPYDGSIAALNSDDIESVTVLKDAAAAALYGSRAANGVIMITTKKGRRGVPRMSVNVSQGFMDRLIPEYDRVNAAQYYEVMWDAYRNSYLSQGQTAAQAGISASNVLTSPNGLVYNAFNVPGRLLVDSVTGKINPNAKQLWNESWEDVMYRTAPRTNASLSLSGGSEGADYYVSAGYLNEQGIVRFSGYERYNTRINVNVTPKKWFNAGVNLDGAFADRKEVPSGGTATTNPFYFTRQMGPIYPVYQHNLTTGALVLDSVSGAPLYDYGVPTQMGTRPYAGRSNIRGTLELDDRSSKIFNGNANMFGEFKFLKHFSFKSTLGLNFYNSNSTSYQNNLYGDAAPSTPGGTDGGRSTKSQGKSMSLTGNQILSYANEFKGVHNVRALVGHENYRYKYNYLSANKSGFIFPGMTDLDNGTTSFSPASSYEDLHTIESYFTNVNYDYDARYLLSASWRTDGSSRFAPDVRWGNFFSVGAGWRIAGESFMKNSKLFNELKLRASYGEQGNDNIGLYYQYLDYYWANGTGGFTASTRVANPALQWEKNSILNFGLDFGMAKNRITGSVDWFVRKSDGLLFEVPKPGSGLYLSEWQNIGTMENSGIELALGLALVRKTDFGWRMDINLSRYNNVIKKLPPNQAKTGIISGTKKLVEGGGIYDFWLPGYAGVDAATGNALYYVDIKDSTGKVIASEVTDQYNRASTSLRKFGSAIPDLMGGITNTFTFKGFELSLLTTFSYGGYFYDGNYASIMHRGSAGTHFSSDILNRWQKPGDVTNIPKVQNANSNNDGASSRWLIDGSWFNIKNITLAYTLPRASAEKIRVNGLRMFVNMDNAWLWTAKKGSDPQRSFTGTADATYTPFRTTSIGASINF